VRVVPGVNGEDAKWSRDGSRLVDSSVDPDSVNGQPGVWRRLRLSNPDGTNPKVLVEQFIPDADVQAHIAKYNFQPPDFDWLTNVRALVGPLNPRWSPTGDQVAFIAARPFDPNGVEYWYQREVWLYDLNSRALTRLTDDQNSDNWISWNGNNTYPDYPQVTVDPVTVTFSQVTAEGLTTIIRDDTAPAPPEGHWAVGSAYRIETTAATAGPTTVRVTYPEGVVSSGAESHLALLRYNEGAAQWEDITASRDTAGNAVTGQPRSVQKLICPPERQPWYSRRSLRFLCWEAPRMGEDAELGLNWAGLPVIVTVARLLSSFAAARRPATPS
jgi:dipeptidyl aminopeptidase/acylaminoacyl peptidase